MINQENLQRERKSNNFDNIARRTVEDAIDETRNKEASVPKKIQIKESKPRICGKGNYRESDQIFFTTRVIASK